MNGQNIHPRNTLRATERLQRRQQIEMLFQCGEAFSVYPLKVVFRLDNLSKSKAGQQSPVRVAFSIPKKRVRLAHHRNRNRRLLREAWRLQKHYLYKAVPPTLQLHVMLIFKGQKILTFENAVDTVGKIMDKLSAEVTKFKPHDKPAGKQK